MSKSTSTFICDSCGNTLSKWYGQCPNCQAWNSIKEIKIPSTQISSTTTASSLKPIPADKVKASQIVRISTDINEVNRVLGGGIVPGSLTLLAGPPGIGKSTLATQIALNLSQNQPILYLAGEENPPQIKIRLHRLTQKIPSSFLFSTDTNVSSLLNLETLSPKPALIIVDSIQTIHSPNLPSQPGSPAQIKQVTHILMQIAKTTLIPIIIIGHITKEGNIAGPKLLEHMVDTVIHFEGDQNHHYRILRAVKNRFGTTNEVGLFTMTSAGLKEIKNPLLLFSSQLKTPIPGAATSVIMEGERPILVEIQALVNPTTLNIPRRVAQGIPVNRLIMLSAIINRRLGLPIGNYDVFVNVTGGLNIHEPAADLAVALAIVSAYKQKPLPAKLALFGEVGLLGEVRPVPFSQRRDKEAKRLGLAQTLAVKPILLKTIVKTLFQ
ncbi:MAG: DNA repair protein RadA [bacterium]|nr:DNA repair protein RadA [bacterium]